MRVAPPPAGALRGGTLITTALLVVAAAVAAPASAADSAGRHAALTAAGSRIAASAAPWQVVLTDVASTGQRTAHTAELLVVAYDDDGQGRSHRYDVRTDGAGTVTVRARDRYTMRFGDAAGSVAHHAGGWFAPLPASGLVRSRKDLVALERKYAIEVVGDETVLDRAATRLDIRRRADGRLRERLWVDATTGLVVRRETFDGEDRPRGLATYLSLEVGAPPQAETARRPDRWPGPHVSRARLDAREHGAQSVPLWRLDALAEAGWTVPSTLPAGYTLSGSYALAADESQPLHLLYSDGLYTVSLFEQRGHPDWGSLPDGAVRSDLLGGDAYEWPGALPRRLVWEADGATFSLVGDAPPDEFAAIAQALPQPGSPDLPRRLAHGLRRLLSWVSPWS